MLKDTGIMVIPVNCVPGVMGKGLAKQFADEFVNARAQHKMLCGIGKLEIGHPVVAYWLRRERTLGLNERYMPTVYFPTKDHWRNKSRIEWIKDGLESLALEMEEGVPSCWKDVSAIIMPALGCGEGGLKYSDVYPLIADFAYSLPEPYHVRLYRPHN